MVHTAPETQVVSPPKGFESAEPIHDLRRVLTPAGSTTLAVKGLCCTNKRSGQQYKGYRKSGHGEEGGGYLGNEECEAHIGLRTEGPRATGLAKTVCSVAQSTPFDSIKQNTGLIVGLIVGLFPLVV